MIWVGNTVYIGEVQGRTTLITCFADRTEIRGDGWDKRKTERNPFPDGRVCRTESLGASYRLARAIAMELEKVQPVKESGDG